jgi:hypothetical protein
MHVIDQEVLQAIFLARQGNKSQAQELLKQVLRRNPDNAEAWVVLAQLVENREEAISSMRRAVRLRPDNQRARRYLDQLLQQSSSIEVPGLSRKPIKAPGPSGKLIAALVAGLALLSVGAVLATVFLWPGAQLAILGMSASCPDLAEQALLLSYNSCRDLGRGQVCYGHPDIRAELVPGAGVPFEKAGDAVALNMLSKLTASPISLARGEWGIGVLKVGANIPNSLPDQTVTLLIFGSSVENNSGDMQTFHFSGSPGSGSCQNVPFDGILVQMADGTGISFRANGADITLMGIGLMEAQPDDKMTISMLSGAGKVGSGGQEQILGRGQQVNVPLSGLDANGPPSEPEIATSEMLAVACTLAGFGCPGTLMPTMELVDMAGTLGVTPSGSTAVADSTDGPTATQRPGEPTWTPAPTRTPGGLTDTPTAEGTQPETLPTDTPTPTPTDTPPATATTSVPTAGGPTSGPPPTTDPVLCNAIYLTGDIVPLSPPDPKLIFALNIANNTAVPITVSSITLNDWPESNGSLIRIALGAMDLFTGSLPHPSVNPAGPRSPTLTGQATVEANTTTLLNFEFTESANTTPYNIELTFSPVNCPSAWSTE